MFSLKLPATRATADYIETQDRLLFTYLPIGGSCHADAIAGYDNDALRTQIGQGTACFERAKDCLRNWAMFPPDWTLILPLKAPLREGETVAMYAKFCGLWWQNACRVVYTVDEPTRFGFAYGTLPGHIESGEELFQVEITADGSVWYQIKAFSKPHHWLAKIGYPIMRRLQAKFRADSANAVVEYVGR